MQPQQQQRQIMPKPKSNGSAAPQRPAVQVEDASDDESSSSESASSGGDDQSSDDSSHDAPVSSGVGSLIAMGGHHAANASTLSSSNGGGSSVSDDFKGLVLAPVVANSHDEPQDPNVLERDSSGWIPLVRPELSSGLSVQVRYLRGLTKAREAQLMGLTAGKGDLGLSSVSI
jgi:hypothetical protein